MPGPWHSGVDLKSDVSELDASTLVYSLHTQYNFFFTPQKVFGAKRLILSKKTHGVGYEVGVTFKDKLYKGFSLNSLPPGLYISKGKGKSDEPEIIKKASNCKKVKPGWFQQYRTKVIKAVCKAFISK